MRFDPGGRRVVLFDLDGTIIESAPGILLTLRETFAELGIVPDPGLDPHEFIGPPILDSAQRFLGLDGPASQRFYATYIRIFDDRGWRGQTDYPGMAALVDELAASGRRVAVTTNKRQVAADAVLERLGIAPSLTALVGTRPAAGVSDKRAVIADALERLGSPSPDETVMIGDRAHDVRGAAALGIPTIGVLWGYGSREELAGAAALAENVKDLARMLLRPPGGS